VDEGGFALLIVLSTFFSTFLAIMTDKIYDRLKLFVAILLNLTVIISMFFAINYASTSHTNDQILVNRADLLGKDWVAREDDLECKVQFFENDSVIFLYSKENSNFSYTYKIDGNKISFYDFDEFDNDVFFEWEVQAFYQNTLKIIEDGDISLTYQCQHR
jgi:hypothetical protein